MLLFAFSIVPESLVNTLTGENYDSRLVKITGKKEEKGKEGIR
jgi:hypothetical protein